MTAPPPTPVRPLNAPPAIPVRIERMPCDPDACISLATVGGIISQQGGRRIPEDQVIERVIEISVEVT